MAIAAAFSDLQRGISAASLSELEMQWELSATCDSTHDALKLARVPFSLIANLATLPCDLPSISEIPFLDCSFAVTSPEWSEWSVLGNRDIDGQTREGERAGAKESMG